ncbi:hypothetical protein HNR01_002023 [Methylorubrum rhodesianum]|uniref:hypothetical protein n=1 Tax=Methylorubrum rhodesianum TaxID=29427 RepID=UPI00160FDD65|nr:hypothetical protein [Methylorubrum rhodesianum]MBB5762403.1 hypothetical protein [Methylorubrum rhodesianum]
MPDIAWPLSSRPGLSPEEGAGRLINAYVEEIGQGGRSPSVIRRAPGLIPFADTGHKRLRGARVAGDRLLAAMRGRLVSIDASGAVRDEGDLPGSARVTMAKNNRSPVPQVVAVTEFGAFEISAGRSASPLPIPTALPAPNSVEFLFGFFFFTCGDGTCYASGLNGTGFNTLDRTKEQGRSAGLMRAIGFRSELFLFGPSEIGVYGGPAQNNGFPLARLTGIPRGLIGPWAVAGHEEGWSNTLIWVGDDSVVYRLNGYSPERISTHDVERDVAAAARVNREEIEASVFMVAGHAFWALSLPGRTWVFDLTTGLWHERVGHQDTRWRATQGVKAFGRWLVGDRRSNSLLEVSEAAFTDAGLPLRMRVESLPGEAFPQRLAIPRADFDFVVGQGLPTGDVTQTDPVVGISWSDDGGATWSNPLTRKLGPMGRTRTRVNVLRTGLTGVQGRTWRLDVSDPVYCALLGGAMAVEARTE